MGTQNSTPSPTSQNTVINVKKSQEKRKYEKLIQEVDMQEFLAYVEENPELAESIFNEWYTEMAVEEGEQMQGDERYYGDDGFEYDPSELYEDFAHCTGHSASYHGGYGVIRELGEQNGFDVDPNDEELQWEVLLILEKEPM